MREIEQTVRACMGERLRLSPLGCVRTRAERILVVEAPDNGAQMPLFPALRAAVHQN
jgi:hypothetical protein